MGIMNFIIDASPSSNDATHNEDWLHVHTLKEVENHKILQQTQIKEWKQMTKGSSVWLRWPNKNNCIAINWVAFGAKSHIFW